MCNYNHGTGRQYEELTLTIQYFIEVLIEYKIDQRILFFFIMQIHFRDSLTACKLAIHNYTVFFST